MNAPYSIALVAASSVVLGIGCAAQTGNDYQGEPLASLNGTLATAEGSPVSEADISIFWGMGVGGTTVLSPEVAFPGTFTLELLSPPPQTALRSQIVTGTDADGNDTTEPTNTPWVCGMIIAHTKGRADAVFTEASSGNEIFGISEYAVCYLQANATAESLLAERLDNQMSAGYHLFQFVRDSEGEAAERSYNDALMACYSDGVSPEECDVTRPPPARSHLESVAMSTPITLTLVNN